MFKELYSYWLIITELWFRTSGRPSRGQQPHYEFLIFCVLFCFSSSIKISFFFSVFFLPILPLFISFVFIFPSCFISPYLRVLSFVCSPYFLVFLLCFISIFPFFFCLFSLFPSSSSLFYFYLPLFLLFVFLISLFFLCVLFLSSSFSFVFILYLFFLYILFLPIFVLLLFALIISLFYLLLYFS